MEKKCSASHSCQDPELPFALKLMILFMVVAIGISSVTVYNVYTKVGIQDESAFVDREKLNNLGMEAASLREEVAALQAFRSLFKTQIRKSYHVKTKVETQIETRPVSLWTTSEE